MTTRDEALDAAGRALAEGRALRDSLPAEDAARLAHVPGGPSVAELTDRITAMRAQPEHHRKPA